MSKDFRMNLSTRLDRSINVSKLYQPAARYPSFKPVQNLKKAEDYEFEILEDNYINGLQPPKSLSSALSSLNLSKGFLSQMQIPSMRDFNKSNWSRVADVSQNNK